MNLLLDSHAFVWMHEEPHKLSQAAFDEISNPNNDVFLSVITVWELQIKIALNKFKIKGNLKNAVEDEQQNNDFKFCPLIFFTLYFDVISFCDIVFQT